MPVSGNEEHGVLSRKSSDISAGIPLKKRRFLLVPPSSPPHHEPQPAFSEVKDEKNNLETSFDLKNKEKASSDCKEKDESCSEVMKKEDYMEDVKNKEEEEESVLDLRSKAESQPDLHEKEESLSDQGPSSMSVANKSPGSKINILEMKKEIISAPIFNSSPLDVDVSGPELPEIRPVNELGSANSVESKTELLLTGKSAGSEVPRTAGGAVFVNVKKEMQSKQVEDDCNLKLSTVSGNDRKELRPKESLLPGFRHQNTHSNVQDNQHPSVLSLSLSKEVPVVEHKSGDTILNRDGKLASANRSNWDLNTTMDAWEGSSGDAAVQCNVDESAKKIDSNSGRPSLNSIPVINAFREKGKQVMSTNEPRSSFPNYSAQLIHQSEDSLRLTLSPSFQKMDFGPVLSALSAKVYNRTDVPNLQSEFVSSVNKNTSVLRVVKSEPTDENSKTNPMGGRDSSTELLDFNLLEKELIEKHNARDLKSAVSSSNQLTEQKGIKSEPTSEVSGDICKTPDLTLQQSIGKFVDSQESGSASSILTMPLTPLKPSPSRLPTSSELSLSADVSNQSEHSFYTKEVHLGADVLVQAAVDTSPKPVYFRDRDENVAGNEIGSRVTEAQNVDDSEMQREKEHLHDFHVNGEGSVSDEEKINISAETMEESYGSDYESDGNQASGSHLDAQDRGLIDDDEYEDGEVREPLLQSKIEDIAPNEIDAENAKLVCDSNDSSSVFPGDTNTHKCQLDDKENKLKIGDDTTVECIKENVGAISSENNEQLTNKDDPSQKLSLDGMAASGPDEKQLCNSYQRKPVDRSGKKSSIEGIVKDISCDGTSSGSRIVTTEGEAKGEIVKAVNVAEKPDSSLSNVEASFSGTNAAKDSISGGNRSRIINLPRTAVTSPCKTRSIPDKLLPSRNGRERYSDLDGQKFFLRGNRDEMDTDGPHRFVRERIHDQSFRNSRANYMRGRGRFSGRLDPSRSEWGSDRDFALGNYNDDYRFTRNKHAAAISDAELECDDQVIAPDGAALSTGRGRKSFNDDLPSFRHPSSRRFSPSSRDGPAGRGVHQMLRRIPRSISPSRRNDEKGMDLVGLRHDEKFVRVLPDDIIDPAYTRPHSMYDNRNFSTFQRRGFPRVRSKSPVGPRTRSPGPWSSPRRRSPDGFNGLQHLAQHRSPVMYGVERMRSPDRSCFPEQMVARRRGSPSYMARPSNETRDVDSGRDHGHPRRINSSRRSPSDRVFHRNTRRLDDLDPRIRTSDDEYFGRLIHPGRFHEFHADGSSDERRKCGERRGLTRPFRPPYIGDSDNSRFHLDDCPRPLRFCPDDDKEFVGRGIREREFDGRMKNRPIVGPRRIRSIDDQEGSYRHAGQVGHDDGFNEGSGFKRRRF